MTDAERKRQQGILEACRAARLPLSASDRLITDGTPLLEAQHQIFDILARGPRDEVDIPAPILERLRDFLREGRTGQVSFNVHQGKILNADIKERLQGNGEKLGNAVKSPPTT